MRTFRIQIFRRVLEAQWVTVAADDKRSARRRALRISRGKSQPVSAAGEDVSEFCDGTPLRDLRIGIVEEGTEP